MPVSMTVRLLQAAVGWADLNENILKLQIRTQGMVCEITTSIGELLHREVPGLFSEPASGMLQTSHKRLKRASMQQEQQSVEALGGRRQAGSGARPGYKGDGRVRGRYRIENKLTTASSHRVKLSDLRKTRAECEGLEVPVYDIQFKEKVTLRTIDNWVLVPRDHWEKLANAQASDDC